MEKLNLQDILDNTSDLSEKKVGYVSIIGRPNAGKSTFINALIGEKISITTSVPQTTRNKILAIYNDEEKQIVFFDTPGIHKSEKKFNEQINSQAISSINDADLVLYFIDSSRSGGEEENYIKEILSGAKIPVLKIYTKVDLPTKITIPSGDSVVKISSETKEGFETLLEKISSYLKVGPMLFGEDFYTKQSLNFRISEIIREKIFYYTKEELPHSVFVNVEELREEQKMYRISAYTYCESDSQKYILIGKNGSLVTKIGKEARIELEEMLGKKVFLALRVKVRKNWRKDTGFIKKMLG